MSDETSIDDPTTIHLAHGFEPREYAIVQAGEDNAFDYITGVPALKRWLTTYSLACIRLRGCKLTVVNHTRVDLSEMVFVTEVKPEKVTP